MCCHSLHNCTHELVVDRYPAPCSQRRRRLLMFQCELVPIHNRLQMVVNEWGFCSITNEAHNLLEKVVDDITFAITCLVLYPDPLRLWNNSVASILSMFGLLSVGCRLLSLCIGSAVWIFIQRRNLRANINIQNPSLIHIVVMP